MYTLALDCTAETVSVSVLKENEVVAQETRAMERGQGEALIPMIREIVMRVGLKMANLDRVAVCVGPGSFTGVRIGLAAARGMGLALNIPVIGVSGLEAAACRSVGSVMVAINTRRGDFYTQCFRDGQPTDEPTLRTMEQIRALAPVTVIGNISEIPDDEIRVMERPLAPAVAVGLCAEEMPRPPEPLYLREADVTCRRSD